MILALNILTNTNIFSPEFDTKVLLTDFISCEVPVKVKDLERYLSFNLSFNLYMLKMIKDTV